jgi:hydrogenase-4 component F
VRDLRSRMPWTGGAWVLASLAVTGAPPFGTFVGELLIVVGAIASGAVWIAALLVLAIFVAFLGVNGQVGRMVFGEPAEGAADVGPEADRGAGIAYLNVAFALAIGVASLPYLAPALRSAAAILGGGAP